MAGTIAIDLGSTTTVIAHQEPGSTPKLLTLPPYSLSDPVVVPSLLWLSDPEQSRPLIGRQVLEAGLAHRDRPELQRDFKRHIAGPADQGAAAGLPLSPGEAGRLLLHGIWRALPDNLNPDRLVVTAPIETYSGYRLWLLEACKELNVAELALVDEPTAAAIGAGLPAGSTVLVLDLGGGTIDLSLVQLQGGEGRAAPIAQLLRFAGRDLRGSRQELRCAQVIGKAGLPLGGRDIDRWIAAMLCPDRPASGSLLQACEQLKCRLSDEEEAMVLWSEGGSRPRPLHLTRAELTGLLQRQGLMAELELLLETVLAAGRAASIQPQDVSAVLAVGGSSRLPGLRSWLQEQFSTVPIHDQHPVEAVALGALALTPGVAVRDVLAQGVCLRCWDRRSNRHHWHPLFMAGQSWPTTAPLELVLACHRNGQRAMELVLGEPTHEQRHEVIYEAGLPVLRLRSAGEAQVTAWATQPLPLPLEPPGQGGEDRLKLRFFINSDATLMLEGFDLLSSQTLPPLRLGQVR